MIRQGLGVRGQGSVIGLYCIAVMTVVAGSIRAEEPCVSGRPPGQRPGPYSFLVATGKERGQLTCYVCETAEKPAIIVFARTASKEIGELAAELDKAVADPKNAPLRGWVTFL